MKVNAGERAHGPQLLPGGRAVLFTLAQAGEGWDDAQIVVQSLDGGARQVVVRGGTDARYLPTGHLVYALRGSLLALPFDVGRLEVTGGPVPLVDEVAQSVGRVSGAAQFAVSGDGTLVYVPRLVERGRDSTVLLGRPDGARGASLCPTWFVPRAETLAGWWAGRLSDCRW